MDLALRPHSRLTDEVSTALRRALEAGDTGPLAGLLADDAVVWHNSDRQELGKEEAMTRIAALSTLASDIRVEVVNHADTAFGFVEQVVLRGLLTKTGRALELYNCIVVTVREALVVRIDEYVDPNAAAQVSGSPK
jgi:ketosteroid isomerase-like protein